MEGLSIEITSYGKAELLSVKEKSIDDSLEEKDVLIDVHYSGINFADIVMRLGMYQDAPPKPFVPGYEISGIVRAVGKGVKRFKLGDKVMVGTRFGGYSSVVKLPDWQVFPLPENFSLAEGAATPVNYITALKFFDDEEWMKKLLVNIEHSQIKPREDVASAHQYLESKKAKGKVFISWRE